MAKQRVWGVLGALLLLVLVYAGIKYRQFSAEWRAFDMARQNLDRVVPVAVGYHWEPGVFSAVGELDLSKRQVTDEQLTAMVTDLRPVTSLVKLDLSQNAISDAGAERLGSLSQLRQLNLAQNQVTDAAVQKLKQQLPECEITR